MSHAIAGDFRYPVLGFVLACLFATLSGQVAMAASAPANAAKPAAAQSSEDVLKWLQMSGGKSAGDAKNEAKSEAKDSAKTTAKDTAPAKPATPVPVQPATAAAPAAAEPKLASVAPVAAAPAASLPVASPIASPVSSPMEPVAELPKVATAMIPADAINTPIAVNMPSVTTLRVVSREQPKFPVEAQNNGVTSGKVKALLHVAVDGSVSKVEILDANPKRTFDRAVTSAAMRWKFAPIAAPETTELIFAFSLE